METVVLNNNSLFKQKTKHFLSLDFIKFILSIIIVFAHFQQCTNTKFENLNFNFGRINFGCVVEFFFIISGFVCINGFKQKSIKSFKTWFLNKCSRLYPMSIITVLITTFVLLLYKFCFGYFPLGIKVNLWNILTSLTLTFASGCINNELGINNPLWFLCVLLICYVVFYFGIWFSNKINVSKIYFFIFMLLIGTATVSYNLKLPFLTPSIGRVFAAFFWGILLFYLFLEEKFFKIFTFLSIIGITSTILSFVLHLGIANQQWEIFMFIFFPSILFLVLIFDSFFKSNIFKFLGGISFEIYIWHFPVILLFICFKKLLGFEQLYTRSEMFIFTFFISLLSIPIHLFLELPLINFVRTSFMEKIE